MTRILVLSDLLAKTEHDANAETPATLRTRPARTEPLRAVVIPPDAEDARVADRIGDAFHRHPENFALGLILILVADVQTGFGRQELDGVVALGQAMLVLFAPLGEPGRIKQLSGRRPPSVVEVPDLEDDRVDRLLDVLCREDAVVHYAFSIAADFEAGLHALQERLLGDATNEELPPTGEPRFDDQGRHDRLFAIMDGLERGHDLIERQGFAEPICDRVHLSVVLAELVVGQRISKRHNNLL